MMSASVRHWLVVATAIALAACFDGGSEEAEPGAGAPPPPAANRAPTISVATTTEVLVGFAVTITPTASDPDGDALTFSVANKPGWLSFNSKTGRLTGTPRAGDAGFYDVTITVSDGQAQAGASGRVNVAQQVAGRATLSWVAPSERLDGSPLTNLAGFKLYYGTSSGNLSSVIQVPDPGARAWVIENLTVGTWFFAASAYDANGAESTRSIAVSKTIA